MRLNLPAVIMNPIPESRAAKAPMMHAIPISPNIIIPISIPKTPTITNKIPIILILGPPVKAVVNSPNSYMYLSMSVLIVSSGLLLIMPYRLSIKTDTTTITRSTFKSFFV